MHCHLVTVKVCVIRSTDQRVQLNRLSLNQYRLKRLDTQAMKRRCPVQQDRVLADHLFENIPDFRLFQLHQLLGLFYGGREAAQFQFAVDKRPEEFQRHLLGQPALVQLQGWADHDDRTSRVVHPLAQKVLAETTLFPLDHVREGFQLPAVGPGYRLAATAIIQERIH